MSTLVKNLVWKACCPLVLHQRSHGIRNSYAMLSEFKSAYSLDKIYPQSSLDMTKMSEPLKKEGDKFSGYIPIDQLQVTYSCSSGPGGQNVNSVKSKVDVRFHVASAKWLPEMIKAQILEKFKVQITKDGFLVLRSERTRSQQLNLADNITKLRSLVQAAAKQQDPPEESTELQKRRLGQWPRVSRKSSWVMMQPPHLTHHHHQIASPLTWRLSVSLQARHYCSGPDGRTTVSLLNRDPQLGLMIDSFSQLGFRLNNGVAVFGPVAVFPRSVLSWNVGAVDDINEGSLSLFYMLEPKLDILVIGVGDYGNRLNPKIYQYMLSKNISLEVLSTEQACSTFNFLNAEQRYVAAALLPPLILSMTDDDVIGSQMQKPHGWEAVSNI